jgi:hypothetical protein
LDRLLPDMTIGEYLLAVRNFLGLNIDIDEHAREVRIDFLNDIQVDGEVLDISRKLEYYDTIEFETKDGYAITQEFNDTDGYPNGAVLEMVRDQIAGEVDYIGDLPVVPPYTGSFNEGEIWYVRQENTYYLLDSTGVLKHSYDHESAKFGKEEIVFATTGSPVLEQMELIPASTGFNYGTLLPKFENKHSDLSVKNPFGLRLMYYRGLVLDSGGYSYPFATGYKRKMLGASPWYQDIGTDSLHPTTESGLYQKRFLKWIDFLSRLKVVKAKGNLSIQDVKNIRSNTRLKAANTVFLWREMDILISERGIEKTEFELVKK